MDNPRHLLRTERRSVFRLDSQRFCERKTTPSTDFSANAANVIAASGEAGFRTSEPQLERFRADDQLRQQLPASGRDLLQQKFATDDVPGASRLPGLKHPRAADSVTLLH